MYQSNFCKLLALMSIVFGRVHWAITKRIKIKKKLKKNMSFVDI
jgi:hypothetical protein